MTKESFGERERRILAFWEENTIFERSVNEREGRPEFATYDGPPFATGLPHYGHFLAGTIKDVVLRFKTMEGFHVPRRNGWDCHGLPVEYEVEKALGLSGAHSIEEFGVGKFNEECRSIVLRFASEWVNHMSRMGRWVDFSDTYHTMDPTFMESIWWVFKELWDKGLVYKGYKVMPFSAKLGTPLSNFEAGENYKEVDDPSLTVAFEAGENTYLLAWTTTPWTLISNLALMVGPEIEYVKVHDKKSGKLYILAASRLSEYYKSQDEYDVVEKLSGNDLIGMRYKPLFDYFSDREAFRVIADNGVGLDEGTGIVHCAPAFGEVDFEACKREGIELVCPVDQNGAFTKEVPEYKGLFVKDADKAIIKRLKEQGSVVHHGTCHHRYPFCWRSDTPLIYKAVSTWFVAVEKIKGRLVELNDQIHWMPEHLKHGRFGKWLEGARDWAISRNRYWGTPIPLWISEEGDLYPIGSIQELEELTGETITDLHRHFIDDLTFEKDGKVYHRIPEVFDCWFESGSMPYAQNHYPFENEMLFEKIFPADFIAEGLDQTRGWFYTLTVLAGALFDKPAFKNVIVNGIVLASDGAKMSKRLKNYPDPMEVVEKYGADAIRLYMLHSPAVRGDDLRFNEQGVELVVRQILLPLWNAHTFFITYANIYNWKPSENPSHPQAEIDGWILSRLQKLVHDVQQGMDNYDLSRAVEPFVQFIDQLTNWYIRRSRRRFWAEEESQDRNEAFETLYQVILTVTKVTAPFIPFISEAIYKNIRAENMPDSVHLCDYPLYQESFRDHCLEEAMESVQIAVTQGHALRKEHKIKVRQPLAKAYVACSNTSIGEYVGSHQQLILDELNVHLVEFVEDETQFVRYVAKPNFRLLGKRAGKQMNILKSAIESLERSELELLMQGKTISIDLEGSPFPLAPEEVVVDREVREGLVASSVHGITIALDTTLNETLILEGLAREIVNKINTMRRDADLDVSDRIEVKMETTNLVKQAFDAHKDYITHEILAVRFDFCSNDGVEWNLNGEVGTIAIERAERNS
ncbi:MAG: isoleucine--tRNA ligase [Waddliaceae bacterium]